MENITVSVVGCGYWGPNLIRNLMTIPGFDVKSICDLDTSRLDYFKSLYPSLETYTQVEDVFHDSAVDAVFIATPVGSHFKLARESLMSHKHTFIEKPLASSSDECRALISLAEERNLTLMVGHTFIYSSPVRQIKEIIDSGEVGEIYCINTQRLNLGIYQKDINVVWDLAPHDISVISYLLGLNPISVNCQGKAHVSKGIEDVANLSLDFHNGEFATVQTSWLNPNKIRNMTIVGSQKMIVYDDVEPLEKIKIYDKRVDPPPHYDSFGEFHYSYHYGDMNVPYINQVEPLKVECQHFKDCILTGAKPESSGEEGLQVVQVLEAASASLRNGGGKIDIGMDTDMPSSNGHADLLLTRKKDKIVKEHHS